MNLETLNQILDLARWAPSGDNTQPWRFHIASNDSIVVIGHDTRDWCLYDFEGHASHIAHGAVLENIRIAASGFGLDAAVSLETNSGLHNPVYTVRLTANPKTNPDPLLPFIRARCVQRRPMLTRPLSDNQRQNLQQAVGADFRVQYFETLSQRLAVAKLLWANAYLRLTCPEAYPVHRDVIQWRSQFSKDRIPDQAVGVDPLTARLMEWVLGSWERVSFFNRFLGGTIMPRVQLDLLPAIRCAAHVLIRPAKPPSCLEDWLSIGGAMQRLWLTVTREGLHLQPEMTPVIFRWYSQTGQQFSREQRLTAGAAKLSKEFESLAGAKANDAFGFFCRIGYSQPPKSRSLRKELADLMDHPG